MLSLGDANAAPTWPFSMELIDSLESGKKRAVADFIEFKNRAVSRRNQRKQVYETIASLLKQNYLGETIVCSDKSLHAECTKHRHKWI